MKKLKDYKNSVCRGSWVMGNNCGNCERCEDTAPTKIDDISKALELLRESSPTRMLLDKLQSELSKAQAEIVELKEKLQKKSVVVNINHSAAEAIITGLAKDIINLKEELRLERGKNEVVENEVSELIDLCNKSSGGWGESEYFDFNRIRYKYNTDCSR